MNEKDDIRYLRDGVNPVDTQIFREIDYFMPYYLL